MRNCNREYGGAACSFCRKQPKHRKQCDMGCMTVGSVRHILHAKSKVVT